MSEHVLEWLGAYLDGELHDDRQRWVAAHLSTCAGCRAELAALQDLALRLQANPPMPTRTPPEQFVAAVRLRLPPRSTSDPDRARVRRAAGLWLPLSVLALWALGQAVLGLTGLALQVVAAPTLPVVLPPLPGLAALPALVALLPPTGWGGWLTLMALDFGLTAAAAALEGACLAGWWAARETGVAASGLAAG